MSIPYRERGYSVERESLIVHERYQDHAPNVWRTTPTGMYAMTGGGAIACPLCFPAPVEPKRTTRKVELPPPDEALMDTVTEGAEPDRPIIINESPEADES